MTLEQDILTVFAACPQCGGVMLRRGGYCRPCRAAYMREWRKTHPPNDEQRRRGLARATLNVAVRRGQIVRGPCERCGSRMTHGHHDDYAKPLEFRWLCRKHHTEHHHGKAAA